VNLMKKDINQDHLRTKLIISL